MPPTTKRQLSAGLLADLKKANAKILDAKTMKPVSLSALRGMSKGAGGTAAGIEFSAWIKI